MSVWIWPVQYHQRFTHLKSSFHEILQGRNKCVKPYTHVLYIEKKQINFLNIFRSGFTFSAKEGYNGNAGLGIGIIPHFFAGICSAPESMLRPENYFYVDAQFPQGIHQVRLSDHRCLIRKNAYRMAFQQGQVNRNPFGPGHDFI